MHQRLIATLLLSCLSGLVCPGAWAQIPVEMRSVNEPASEPQPLRRPQPAVQKNNPNTAEVQQPDTFYQLQLLQEEVRQLHGQVEQLQHQLEQVRQRQMDDYMDLDRRITGSRGAATPLAPAQTTRPAAAPSPAARPATSPPVPVAGTAAGASKPAVTQGASPVNDAEIEQYSAAYNLLKERKINEAETGFQRYVARYPAGRYVANAHYWLGEINLLQNNLEEARQSFTVVVENFPDDRKASDATFKLGKVYHLLGDNERAKQLLTQASKGTDTAAKLAQTYLQNNF